MDEGKRRALIRKNAIERAKKWQGGEVPPTEGTTPINPFLKWKPTDKGNRPTKKPKDVVTAIVGEKSRSIQMPPPLHGAGKGLMTASGPIPEKYPLSSMTTLVAQ